jgi:DNA polymerase III delta prime subunit
MPPEVPRPDLEDALRRRAIKGPPLILAGPPGSGKTTLLRSLARQLGTDGFAPLYLDLMGAASTPERFVIAALAALPAEGFASRLAEATEIRRLAAAGRAKGEQALGALLSFWASLDQVSGRPVVLLFDEATEIRSLAYFKGLREVHEPFGAALAARRRGTILATSFPTAAGKLWRFETLVARPLTAADLAPLARGSAEAVARASCGWPRYARLILERMERDESDALTAWARAMAPGEPLEVACRATHETLLLRSRGYGISKAALAAVAQDEGLTLTELVPILGRTPGAVRDYLQWLVGVDALRMTKKRYFYVDGVLRQWVRLHARGVTPTAAELQRAARELVEGAAGESLASAPAPQGSERDEQESAAVAARRDSLIEID